MNESAINVVGLWAIPAVIFVGLWIVSGSIDRLTAAVKEVTKIGKADH